ncbi:S8 family serine peptidase [Massilia pseudoviolaceinigra]|uniref:S8 family serine peptidase n=1 Tax=Massilia pseudoviolaceinigra TaxID=3057165 RepID=UPI0027963EDD|nr:S8 family serine peptidase [Massilia sp. CCM 9206]MDQ1918932.1 S8 family serine peptidase [Massilia sp. CCM 9206]
MGNQSKLQGRPGGQYDRARVVVRFHENTRLDPTGDLGEQIDRSNLGSWKKLLGQFPGLTISPVFTLIKGNELEELIQRAVQMDRTYKPANFGAFYYIDAPANIDLVALARTLLRWPSVQTAYIDHAAPAPVNPSDDPERVNQGYLDPAPDGIDAEYAWGQPGGDGVGQRLVDLESGWTLDHEDLAAHGATLLHGFIDDTMRRHGTSVLGIICAVDNTVGCVGIVPEISVDVVSHYGSTRPNAIFAAIAHQSFGEVLLLEAQVYLNGTPVRGPIEAYDADYEAIRLATALGIIVIETGGNGTGGSPPALNMDTYTTLSGQAILNRDEANPEFRDSGAIMVTAASAAAPHTRLPFAPHGKRIDCYAWGESITTLNSIPGSLTSGYTTGYGGTSGAAAIIAGAALAVQGGAVAQSPASGRLSPRQMRDILSDTARGTLPSPAETTRIGAMPNLRKIFDEVLGVTPDIYIRDFVGDTGDPHGGAISASPDVFIRASASADPQAEFGSSSTLADSLDLGSTANPSHDNFIYVRVKNRGGAAATAVTATVFWSPVATLVTPDLWTLVGSTTLPSVPATDLLTVSPAIVWPAAAIPAPNHYCFVALIGSAGDPAPAPADFLVWDNFTTFIRANNNVTWRNFNVVPYEVELIDAPALEFLAPGAPDQGREMALEIVGRLPPGTALALEVPLVFLQMLRERQLAPGNAVIDQDRRVALIALNPNMPIRLGNVLFPAKSRMAFRLLVRIPEENRGQTFQIFVRQVWQQQEVGRVTWQLQPKS